MYTEFDELLAVARSIARGGREEQGGEAPEIWTDFGRLLRLEPIYHCLSWFAMATQAIESLQCLYEPHTRRSTGTIFHYYLLSISSAPSLPFSSPVWSCAVPRRFPHPEASATCPWPLRSGPLRFSCSWAERHTRPPHQLHTRTTHNTDERACWNTYTLARILLPPPAPPPPPPPPSS